MDQRTFHQTAAVPREQSWIPPATIVKLREVVTRYLSGERGEDREVEQLAAALASAAHAAGHAPERLIIALRELWRDYTLSQHDRLQLAALYDRLVRRTIDRYYQD